jgi:hypothetical protein
VSGAVPRPPSWLEELWAPIAAIVAPEPVEIRGAWSTSTRRTATVGGALVDVADVRWRGAIIGRSPLAALLFSSRPEGFGWCKSRRASAPLPLEVSLHARADDRSDRATLAVALHGSVPATVTVACGRDLTAACAVGSDGVVLGRPFTVVHAAGAHFIALLVPAAALQVGRNHLWRMRAELAAALPPPLRELLTRARTGALARPGI